MRFSELDVPPEVRRDRSHTTATPIQGGAAGRPSRHDGRPAQTGTGKTAAFQSTFTAPPSPAGGIPEVSPRRSRTRGLLSDRCGRPRSAVSRLRTALVFGGWTTSSSGVPGPLDLLVGTPGRLIDYLKQRAYRRRVECRSDEADPMSDMGFIADIRWIFH